jgi:hypothetical protein
VDPLKLLPRIRFRALQTVFYATTRYGQVNGGNKATEQYLELYKLAVEMADRVSARRTTAKYTLRMCSTVRRLLGWSDRGYAPLGCLLLIEALGSSPEFIANSSLPTIIGRRITQ